MKNQPTISVRGLPLGTAGTAAPLEFDTHEGEVLAVIGDNGTGKSVLLSILSGILRPAGGSVRVFGFDLFDLRQRKIAQSFDAVAQQQRENQQHLVLS